MENSNPFIFKAGKNIAWVQDKQAINFRLEPHQSWLLNMAQIKAVRTESLAVKGHEREALLYRQCQLSSPRWLSPSLPSPASMLKGSSVGK